MTDRSACLCCNFSKENMGGAGSTPLGERVLMLGLDNAGKSSALRAVTSKESIQHVMPTQVKRFLVPES